MRKKAIILTLMALTIASLSACSKKAEVPTETAETVQESTKDPFSLGDIPIVVPTAPVKESEVIETQADGTYTALLVDGNTRVTLNGTNLKNYSKLSEEEAVYLDAIIGAWKGDSTLPTGYLEREVTEQAFPSLTDKERKVTISEIAYETPHPESDTKPLPEQETVSGNEQGQGLTEEEIKKKLDSMTDEEKDRLIEGDSGKITVGHPDDIDTDLFINTPMGGAQ